MSLTIGLFVPRAVPPSRGGFERLVDGFEAALGQVGTCVRVDVPVDERTWEGVLSGYKDFYAADASPYDIVISTKGPSYLVQHSNHVCYLAHRMRVFYDMYEERGEEHAKRRELVHRMDAAALSAPRTRRLYAIGHTVARRLAKWGGHAAEVLHPPTNLAGLHPGRYEHLLYVSRLHRWKRGDLVIRAYRKVSGDVPLFIVGTGEDEAAWKELAAVDRRIRFLGRVSDAELVDLYADALAVVFPPKNEDFGYITVESFLSRTPVITCTDSGEPCEFVIDGETGLVAEPMVDGMAAKLAYCVEHRHLAPQWGAAGYEKVKDIRWEGVVDRILQLEAPPSVHVAPAAPTIKLVATDNQPLSPAIGGGRIRIGQLYSHFPPGFEIDYVGTYDHLAPDNVAQERKLGEHFREHRVAMTALHAYHQDRRQARAGGKVVADVLFAELSRYSPRFERVLRELAAHADVLVACHPWPAHYLTPAPGQLLVYDSQNCELAIKGELFGDGWHDRKIVAHVRQEEKDLCRRADLIFVCSEEDGRLFQELYGVPADRIVPVPNGVDSRAYRPASPDEREAARRALHVETAHAAIFVGSAYGPNTEAVHFIASRLVDAFSDTTFLILGNVQDSYLEFCERRGIVRKPAVSRTGLGEGWFAAEDWGMPVRWTKREAWIGATVAEDGQLRFDAFTPKAKTLRVVCNREAPQVFRLPAETWTPCQVQLAPGRPNAVELAVGDTHRASASDPRQLGVAIAHLSKRDASGDEDIPLSGPAGGGVVGDRFNLMGVVSDEVKRLAYQAADVALNPMLTGSGSNIKIFEYLAAGLPVLTTPVGARGAVGESERHFLLAEPEAYPAALGRLLSDPRLCETLAREGRRLAVEQYDWSVIAERAARAVREALKKKRGG